VLFELSLLLGIIDSTAPTTVPAAVAATCVTVSATLLIVAPTLRIVCFALRFDGIFFATFFTIVRARFAPRDAIDFIFVIRPPRAAGFFAVVVFAGAFFEDFLAVVFFFMPLDRFAIFLAMQAPLSCRFVESRL
jgi:hypothetical protein